jgi:hypothetical protein
MGQQRRDGNYISLNRHDTTSSILHSDEPPSSIRLIYPQQTRRTLGIDAIIRSQKTACTVTSKENHCEGFVRGAKADKELIEWVFLSIDCRHQMSDKIIFGDHREA